MECKTCKHYDNGWDGFCKLHPEQALSPSPQVAPKMICNGDEYENINTKLTPIYICSYKYKNKPIEELKGKRIKDMVITYKAYDDEHDYVVITFTDNTYIALGIDHTEKDGIEYCRFSNARLPSEDELVKIAAYNMYENPNTGESKLYDHIQVLVDIGLYDITPEIVQEAKNKRIKDLEDQEHQYYLRLKEKYENK